MVEPSGERVVVLGGGGFVGSAIVQALRGAGFAAVSAQRRSGVAVAEQRVCDATDAAALTNLLRGAGCVVNAVLSDPASMLAATRNTVEAACRLGLRRVVHLSSMAVYGLAVGLVDETAALLGRGRYASAKIACERALGDDAVMLRPGLVYGAGGEQWVGRIGWLLRAGRLGDLGQAGDGRCNLIHSRDVGAAVVAALQRPVLEERIFNLSTPSPSRWNSVFISFAQAIGAVPVQRLGLWQLSREAWIRAPILQLARFGGFSKQSCGPMPRSLLRLFAQDITLDHRLADRVLGFRRTPDADGLAESAAWFVGKYGNAHR